MRRFARIIYKLTILWSLWTFAVNLLPISSQLVILILGMIGSLAVAFGETDGRS
jgi:hypothetical protein